MAPAPAPRATLTTRIQTLNSFLASLIALLLLSLVAIVLLCTGMTFVVRVACGVVRNVVQWNPYVLGSSGHLLGELVGEFVFSFWAGWGVWMD